MNRKMKRLLLEALHGDAAACRKLGLCFLRRRWSRDNRLLAEACLKKSMESGDEEAFFIYHEAFKKGQTCIDDASYRDFCEAYHAADDPEEKRRLKRYLQLGTERQKKENGLHTPL